jgi:hypothetical protein
MTTEAKFNAQVEAELAAQVEAELQAEMGRKRAEIAARLRREAFSKEMNRINQRHPIEDKYGGLGPEGHAARLKAMEAGSKADREWMDRVNSRPVDGSLLDQRRRADSAGGNAGFRIKPLGGA